MRTVTGLAEGLRPAGLMIEDRVSVPDLPAGG